VLSGKELQLCVPPDERAHFVRALSSNRLRVVAQLTGFDLRRARASVAEDHRQIMSLIRHQYALGLLSLPQSDSGEGRRLSRPILQPSMGDPAIEAFNAHVDLAVRKALAAASWII
jgi:hypothetical protein